MPDPLSFLSTLFDLGIVVLGFGFIIFVHELGHFLAARWAGIRVLAFAVGFGPAALAYRKGLGLRRGGTEEEVRRVIKDRPEMAARISPTEYRLNWLPFGGYVKMLGQEDLNPDAVSSASDSYQNCVPWKRMIVISAGVVMNILTAAVLFMIVFKVGLRTEPAIVGEVAPGSPAAVSVAVNSQSDVTSPGLRAGDEILSINGSTPRQFSDVVMEAAMASRGEPLDVRVRRPGVERELSFSIVPDADRASRLLEIGVRPAASTLLVDARTQAARQEIEAALARLGLGGVQAGMRLETINAQPARFAHDLAAAADVSGGNPLRLGFVSSSGERVESVIDPTPRLEQSRVRGPSGEVQRVEHLLGLSGVFRIRLDPTMTRARGMGLQDGDVMVRLGAIEYPSPASAVAQIRASAGRELPAIVRRTEKGVATDIALQLRVSREGTLGVGVGDTIDESTLLGSPVASVLAEDRGDPAKSPVITTAAARAGIPAGAVILRVAGRDVQNFGEIRAALRDASKDALAAAAPAKVPLDLQTARGTPETIELELTAQEVQRLHALGWRVALTPEYFQPEQTLLQASGPLDALRTGLSETHRIMIMTYVTFARLWEGTVRVEHLKGPVGIAHVGTLIADRGLIWVLFFMALISVNLAVVNFLPLPIVDGGQFLFILYEQIFRRPVPISVQNVATLAGLLLIGSLFVIVTFNDITNLFRG